MSMIKCKMCGGELIIPIGLTICECEYCGSKQTVPNTDDEKRLKLYERANKLRYECEFDKAFGVYESIVAEYQSEAEAYWGLVLCKYGIEYVDDPQTGKKIPTCHRSSFDSVFDDENFDLVMENADVIARGVYREEAKQIEELRKGIIEVSSKEEAYDIFICYKETSDDGQRTLDSVIAQDVYEKLIEKDYKVFFSRITLEDKLGQEYEPYIFAALNSAKVMLVFGTSYDYYNAVWVKNEWSRFLQLMESGQNKTIIPCYRDIDAYDMPKEFAKLQAQDMGKVGAIQDLIRGIDKIFGKDREKSKVKETVVVQKNAGMNNEALIKRGKIALEDKEWQKADSFFEDVLNQDAECAEAYLGKWLSDNQRSDLKGLEDFFIQKYDVVLSERLEACPPDDEHIISSSRQYEVKGFLNDNDIIKMYEYDRTYESFLADRKNKKEQALVEINNDKLLVRAKQYAHGDLAVSLKNALHNVATFLEEKISISLADDKQKIDEVTSLYQSFISEIDAKVQEQYNRAIDLREASYQSNVLSFNNAKDINAYERIKDNFQKMYGYKDSVKYIQNCDLKIVKLKDEKKAAEEKQRIDFELAEKAKARKKKVIVFSIVASLVLCLIAYMVITSVIKNNKYNHAMELSQNGDYVGAIELYKELGEYKDSVNNLSSTYYEYGVDKFSKEDYSGALVLLQQGSGEDIDKYISYCELEITLSDIPDGTELSGLMKKIDSLDGFNDADSLKEKIPNLDGIQSKMDSWWKTNLDIYRDNGTEYIRISEDYKILTRFYVKGELDDEYDGEIRWRIKTNGWGNGIVSGDWFNDPNYSDDLYTKYEGTLK